jgi:hypothetical protein
MNWIIKAGLLTASLAAFSAPALAQPDDQDHSDHGGRGGGDRGRGNDNGGRDRDSGNRGNGGENRAPAAAPQVSAPPPAPVYRATAPVASPAADNPRFQRGNVEQPRPGTPQWYSQRGAAIPAAPPAPQPDRNNAAQDRGRSNGGWQNNGGRDRDNGDRDGNWNRDNHDGRDQGRNGNGRDNDGRNWNDNRNDNRSWNDNRGSWNNGRPGVRPPVANRWDGQRRWDRNSWRNDRRYDWQDWRRYHRDVYRLPPYRAPYGWNRGYYRFSIGIYIDSILFGDSYWIDDPWTYRLPPAYGPLRWVRYYDDAVLIDVRDGYVVDVIYDFFW